MSKKISLIFSVLIFSFVFLSNTNSAYARIDYEHLNNYNRSCYPLCNLTAYRKSVTTRSVNFQNEENQNSVNNNNYSQAGIDPNNPGNNNQNQSNSLNQNNSKGNNNVGNQNGNTGNINANQNGNNQNDYYAANFNQNSNRRLATTGIGSYALASLVIIITSGIIWFIRKKREERDNSLNKIIENISF